MFQRWGTVRLRTWALLMSAFLLVGGLTSYFLYSVMRDRVMADSRADLIGMVRLASLQVDGDEHEKLTDPDQMESELYVKQVRKLDAALSRAPGVRFVYTMRKVDGKFYFILDPTPAGDHDGDGVDDKSYLMDEYEEHDPTLDRAFKSGEAIAAEDFYTDQWGTFLSAYAPIFNKEGKLVAVLGMDRQADQISGHVSRIRSVAWLSFAIAVVVGLIFSTYLTRHLTPEAMEKSNIRFDSMTSVHEVLLQLILGGLVVGTLFTGGYGFALVGDDGVATKELDGRDEKLRSMRSFLIRVAIEERLDNETIALLRREADELQPGWLGSAIDDLEKTLESDPEQWRTPLRSIADSLHDASQGIIRARNLIREEQAERRVNFSIVLTVAALLSIASLGFVRAAFAQQGRLLRQMKKTESLKQSHQLIVESLPIGLFQFKGGDVFFSNWTFDLQTKRTTDESAKDALVRALHPDDRERVMERLSAQEVLEEPFSFQFRMLDDDRVKYFESRGVPLFNEKGELRSLICYNIDITDIVEANKSLQDTNRELESANLQLSRTFDELQANFVAMVQALVKAVEAKDPYTAGHSERVKQYSVMIGDGFGLSEAEMQTLEMGALIHDIGKIGIPDGILTKPDKLTDEEYEIIKRHVTVGSEMVQTIPLFKDCIPIVRSHHERLDGTGYPDALHGDQLSTLVRIAAVADSFDAMTSTRAYRKGLSAEIAIAELRKDVEKGRLDGRFVEILADKISKHGVIEHETGSMAA